MSAKEGLRRIAKIFIATGALCAAAGTGFAAHSVFFNDGRVISYACKESNACGEDENAAITKHRAIEMTQQEKTVSQGTPVDNTSMKWVGVLQNPAFIRLSESDKLTAQEEYFEEVLAAGVAPEKRPFIKAHFLAKNEPGASSTKYATVWAHDIPNSDPFWQSMEQRPDWGNAALSMGFGLTGLLLFGLIGWVILGFAGQPKPRSDI